jgi:hypothetical protein
MAEIRVYKLKTGNEIIGEFLEETDDTFVLTKVRSVHPVQGPEGLHVMLLPFVYSNTDTDLEFYFDDVITYLMPDEDMEKSYYEHTTGLDIATSFGV